MNYISESNRYPFGKPVELEGDDGYKSIKCPHCGFSNMHIEGLYQTLYSDDQITIRLSCEGCPSTSDLLLNSYKGNVYLGFATRDITEADLLPRWIKVDAKV
tara:strand:+ start:3852 stop:4157 length:306 start_codon:yes stop_codon:yes gene_type:complete